VRFDGWQATSGERGGGLRKHYLKYKLPGHDLFEKAYGYIQEHFQYSRPTIPVVCETEEQHSTDLL
jgi:hypothetical protein